MFSKEESKKIRQEFWISFDEKHPRKWLLYNTKIKDFSLKFTFTTKKAQVSIDIESQDEIIKAYYYDKILSLKSILTTEYINDIIFDPEYVLDNYKVISRAYIELNNVSIHNKKTWDDVYSFLFYNMDRLESFFNEYRDFIES